MPNNLTQQTPTYYYGYGAQNPYQRPLVPIQEPSPPVQAPMAGYNMPYIPQQNLIKGRPVVSIDEARAAQIDLDGSLYVFPDIGNKKIYTKQINMDGTATFNVFELAPQAPQSAPEQLDYVTKSELEKILTDFRQSLVQEKPVKANVAPLNLNL